MENGEIKLKAQSLYYYQVQGQLKITKRVLCYFIIYTDSWTQIIDIKYDKLFWTNKMEKQLKL